MEKASSGTPRLTRRSAAQKVQTPQKTVDKEENGNCEEEDEAKKGSSRKVGRPRRSEAKPKTNGESSIKPDGMNNDANSLDGCESESSVTSEKQKSTNTNSTRKSLRVRRSITPGPDSETNSVKKLKRSTSESKLDSLATPTKRRSERAQSEGKDFFTPKKEVDQRDEPEVASKNLRPSTLLVPGIESIIEDEEDSSQDDPLPLSEYVKKIKPSTVEEQDSVEQDKGPGANVTINEKESIQASESCTKTDTDIMSSDLCQIVNNESKNALEHLAADKTEQLIEVGSKTESNITTLLVEKEEDEIVLNSTKIDQTESCSSDVVASQTNSNETVSLSTESVLNKEPSSHVALEDQREENSSPSGEPICDKVEVRDSVEDVSFCPREQEPMQETAEPKNHGLLENEMEKDPSDNIDTDSKQESFREECKTQLAEETNHEKEIIISNQNENESKTQLIEETNHERQLSSSNKAETDSLEQEMENIECEDNTKKMESTEEAHNEAQLILNVDETSEVSPSEDIEQQHEPTHDVNEPKFSNDEVDNDQHMVEDKDVSFIMTDLQKEEDIEDGEAVLIEDSNDNINEEVENINLSYHEEDKDCINEDEDQIGLEIKESGKTFPENSSTSGNHHAEEKCTSQIDNCTLNNDASETAVEEKENAQESDPIEIWDDCSEEASQIKITEVYQVDNNLVDPLGNVTEPSHVKESFSKSGELNNEDYKNALDDEKHSISSEEESLDIYKDLSNDEEQKDDEKSGSSSSQSANTYDSSLIDEEEEEEEDDYEEEEQDSEMRKGEEDDTKKSVQDTEKEKIPAQDHPENQVLANKKGLLAEEGSLETASPMTYDRALAILNKDRDKKIDDEEFFDMFTQELNKVSEPEANSDSDIAIVDEYIPENPPKPKPVIKTIKIQRPIHRPQAPLQQHYPPQHSQFAGHFNQIQSQHPPNVPRVNFPQDVPLSQHHQFNQDFSHINAMRNQNIYKHYGASTDSVPDPRLYDSHIPTQVPTENPGFFGYKLGNPVENPLHYSGPLKIRNIDAMSMHPTHADNHNQNYQPSQINNQMFYDPNLASSSGNLQSKNNEHHENNQMFDRNYESNRSSSPEHANRMSHTPTKRDVGKENTPILDLLGLDKTQLNLLKLELRKLNLKKQRQKSKLNKMESLKTLLTKIDKEDFLSQSGLASCEVSNDCSYPGSSRDNRYQYSSTESSSSDSEALNSARKIHVDEDSVSVTIPVATDKKQRRRHRKRKSEGSGRVQDTINETLLMRRERKKLKRKSPSNQYSSDDSVRENFVSLKKRKLASPQNDSDSEDQKSPKKEKRRKVKETNSSSSLFKKMVQKKQKKTGFLQSRCGVFTVENPPSATSQSSESDGASQSSSSDYLEGVKRRIKSDIQTGKNKLCNIFTQQSLKANSKKRRSLKTGRIEKKRSRPARVLKKLPAEVLEQLEEEAKQKQVSTDSDVDRENSKKKRKKSKVKVKSAALKKEYIPYVTPDPVATQFSLNRLDVEDVLTTARNAAKFRSDQLYGASVQRITSKELMNIKKKKERTNPKRK